MFKEIKHIKDIFSKYFHLDFEKMKKNKFSGAEVLVVLFFILFVVMSNFLDDGEEEILQLPQPVQTIQQKNEPKEIFKKKSDENITPIIGANSQELLLQNPFKITQKKIIKQTPPETVSTPQVIFQPPLPNALQLKETFLLKGTAIGGSNKTALFQKKVADNKSSTDLFLSVGETIQGRRIVDITQNGVKFDNGEFLTLQGEIK